MDDRRRIGFSRRAFLKGSLGAGMALGIGWSYRLDLLRDAAAEARIRAEDWHTLPLNDGRTVAAGADDLGGTLQLNRDPDGSFQSSREFVSDVYTSSSDFNMTGMRWVADLPPGTSIAVEVRGSQDGSNWSGWSPVGHELPGIDDHPESNETFTDPVELGRARAMQYRITLTTSDPAVSPTVNRVTATQLDSLDSPRLEDLDERGEAIPFRVGNGGSHTARLILRAGPTGWGPSYISPDSPLYWDPQSGQWPFEFVTIHHTAGANNPENPVATVRAIWYFHAITRGWGDIGYHFLVDQYGNVYQGRAGGTATVAGHAFRFNHYNCGISLLGQFQPGATDVPYEGGEPTAEAVDSAMRLAALHAAYYDFDPLEQHAYPKPPSWCRPQLTNYRVCGHRDWGREYSCTKTVCPGENLYKHLPNIREGAAELIPSIKDFSFMEHINHQ